MNCTECGREFVHIEDDEGMCDECWENRFPSIPNEIVKPNRRFKEGKFPVTRPSRRGHR